MVDERGKYTWDAGKDLYGKQVGVDADDTGTNDNINYRKVRTYSLLQEWQKVWWMN